jgi:hypothetical protein
VRLYEVLFWNPHIFCSLFLERLVARLLLDSLDGLLLSSGLTLRDSCVPGVLLMSCVSQYSNNSKWDQGFNHFYRFLTVSFLFFGYTARYSYHDRNKHRRHVSHILLFSYVFDLYIFLVSSSSTVYTDSTPIRFLHISTNRSVIQAQPVTSRRCLGIFKYRVSFIHGKDRLEQLN